jgi:hypothetical protein
LPSPLKRFWERAAAIGRPGLSKWFYRLQRPPFSSVWLLLGVITLLGGIFRLAGVLHGFPERFTYHPDAGLIFPEAWRVFLTGETQGAYFGPVYLRLLVLGMQALNHIGLFLGYPIVWSQEHIGAVASLLSAALGTATIPLVYFLGARAFGKSVGLLSALLLSVNPLHTFHSHYPYRDVPLVFFLTLTVLFCLRIAQRPTWWNIAGGSLLGLISAAVKPAGLVSFIPLFSAALIGLLRSRKWHTLLLMAVMFALAMLLMHYFRLSFLITQHGNLLYFAYFYVTALATNILSGLQTSLLLQEYWLGYPLLITFLAGLFLAFWRRTDQDLVLLSFFLPAFLLSAAYRYLDERFLVFLLPVALTLAGRLFVDLDRLLARRTAGRFLVTAAALALLTQGATQSWWQGLLLALPDTLTLSEKWLKAHLPRDTSIAMQGGYYPNDLNNWPRVSFLDPSRPLAEERKKGEIIVTSSADYLHRWLLVPKKFPRENRFYRELPREATLMKSIAFEPRGFVHSQVDVYLTDPPPADGLRLNLPRPYDAAWNDGISFVHRSPYDRDDRTFLLKGIDQRTTRLVSPERLGQVAVFLQNSDHPCRVRVQVDRKVKIRDLKAGEKQVLFFEPSWFLPRKPALYSVHLITTDPEALILAHLRCRDLEIAETYFNWEYWRDAAAFLERHLRRDPGDIDSRILLAAAFEKMGQPDAVRDGIRFIRGQHARGLEHYLSLGRDDPEPLSWKARFRAGTGLDPDILTYALARDFEAETFYGISLARQKDAGASGDYKITYSPPNRTTEFFVNEGLLLPPGAYTAWFLLQTPAPKNNEPLAVIRIYSGQQEVAFRRLRAADLSDPQGFTKIGLPFVHDQPLKGLVVHMTPSGRLPFSLDKVRLEPDLPTLCRLKTELLQYLSTR